MGGPSNEEEEEGVGGSNNLGALLLATNNQSCHVLMAIFDIIDQLQLPKYNLYSSTLFYTHLFISTALYSY